MKNIRTFISSAKAVIAAASLIAILSQCTTEEEMVTPTAEIQTSAASASTDEVGSLSIQGLYTEVRQGVDCSTCTFVVDSKTTTVDGQELGFKPGSVICLQTGVRYGSIDFVNMEGTEADPIVISYCSK